MEILAPVGSFEMLDAALAAGCDAVYLAMKQFGARAYANNFTLEEVKEIVRRCHLVGVAVHVTMNIVLYEDEIEIAYQQAKDLYRVGVDALIVQDLGLIHLLHHRLPDMCVHASTQMSIRTPKQIENLKKLGVKRVVLARECSKSEVEICQQCGVEIETFVHGALCISVSGQCYFSSFCYGRSGNRGMCAQPCRMAYTLYKDGQKIDYKDAYLLSPKDISVIDKIPELSVDSLKIEGRMKSPVYVYEAVRQVKKVRDGQKRTSEDLQRLKLAFNRGYTLGHMFNKQGLDLMHMASPNHQGVPIGKVIGVSKRRVRIKLTSELDQNDGIRFDREHGCRVNYLYDAKGHLQNHIDANQICEVDAKSGIRKGSVVYKTISYALEKEVEKASKETIRKVDVSCFVSCDGVGKPLVCTLDDGKHQVTCQTEEVAQLAQKRGLDEATVSKQMHKTKDSWVELSDFSCTLADSIFFPMGIINALRRKTIDALAEKRTQVPSVIEKPYIFDCSIHSDEKVYTCLSEDVADQTKNVTNSYGIAACLEMGYQKILLSVEMQPEQIQKTALAFLKRYHQKPPVIVDIYGKVCFMTMQHCPINTICKDGTRKNCNLCHTHRFEMEGKDGRRIYMEGNADCFMRLFDETPRDWTAYKDEFKQWGISNFYVHFIDENRPERARILDGFSLKEGC